LPSFSRALFLGKLNSGSVYPYPVQGVLSDEVKGTLSMLVEPTAKFMSERNNAAQNDENAAVPEAVLDELKGLGAFGMQVRNMLLCSSDGPCGCSPVRESSSMRAGISSSATGRASGCDEGESTAPAQQCLPSPNSNLELPPASAVAQ
jgi:hypothetical protein